MTDRYTPWRWDYERHRLENSRRESVIIPLPFNQGYEPRDEATASYMLTAVNAHDDLVEIANGVLRLEFALSSPKYISADIPILIDALAEKVRDLSQETTP